MATVPADAAAMVEEARKAGVTLGLVHNYLFQPEIILARELIRSGALGQVEVVIINYLGVYDFPGNAAYDPTWRHDLARSGGGIFIDIIHLAYLAEALLDRRVERVSAYANARTMGAGVEDIVVVPLRDSRERGRSSMSAGAPVRDGIDGPGGIEVSGTDGRLAIAYENGGTFAPFQELRLTDRAGTRVIETTAKAPQGTVPLAVQEFAEAVARSSRPGRTRRGRPAHPRSRDGGV